MKTLPLLAVLAALALAPAMPAFAQSPLDPDHGDTPLPTPEPTCQVDCGGDDDDDGSSTVGDPWYPPFPDPGCKTDCGPGTPGKPGNGQAVLGDNCGSKLGLLRPVAPSQIESVGSDALVDIVPVCRRKGLSSLQHEVASLRDDIARNPVLDTELGHEGYDPAEVVGVIVNGPAVTLYVHAR